MRISDIYFFVSSYFDTCGYLFFHMFVISLMWSKSKMTNFLIFRSLSVASIRNIVIDNINKSKIGTRVSDISIYFFVPSYLDIYFLIRS